MSQRMKTQIISISKSIDNASDAVGLLNTADGALEEVSGLLQRMRELSLAAANGTQNSADLTSLNNEYQMMLAEIARIGANTEWNEKKLFDGEGFPGETEFQVGANVSQTIGVTIDKLVTSELGNVVGASGFSTHSTTPPSAVTTQDSYTSHSGTAPSVQTTAGVRASLGSDIDGDGDIDVIHFQYGHNTFRTFLNDGSGNFTYGSQPAGVPSGAIYRAYSGSHFDLATASADIDGDGDVDILTHRSNVNYFHTYLNDGNGNFSYGAQISGLQSTSNGGADTAMELADIDGDGDFDLIQREGYSSSIITLINDGSGNFSAGSTIDISAQQNSPFGSLALAASDVDGDGDVDIVHQEHDSANVNTYINDGAGNFSFGTATQVYRSDSYAEVAIAAGDIDGDGDEDLMHDYTSEGSLTKLINDGNGNYTVVSPPMSTAPAGINHGLPDGMGLADVDGDGDTDIVSTGQLNNTFSASLNDGNGNFSFGSQTIATGSGIAGGRDAGLEVSAASAAVPSRSTINMGSLNLALGDRVTITVPGGTNVSAVMDSSGLNTLLTSLGNSLAAQSSLFSGASNSGGTLTINGLADGSAMPSLSVTLEDGVDTSRFDFNNKNLVEGDQIVIKVTGGTDVQGTIDSNGLDTLLGTLATQLQSQSSLFSNASVSSGVLSLTGLSNGSAITGVTVEMNTASSPIGRTNISSRNATEIALGSVDKAIEEVSAMRVKYGAATNQMTHAIGNLTEEKINAESSMSRIKDADYATETSRLAINQIINQAATAMLAQANNSQELTMSLIKDWL